MGLETHATMRPESALTVSFGDGELAPCRPRPKCLSEYW